MQVSTEEADNIGLRAVKPVQQSPSSPDLSPSDYDLFPKVKKELSGRPFDSDDDVIAAFGRDADFTKEEIRVLHDCRSEGVNAGGDCVENLMCSVY